MKSRFLNNNSDCSILSDVQRGEISYCPRQMRYRYLPHSLDRRIICVMIRRGNPNWGKPPQYPPAGPTEFDIQVRRLRLTRAQYVASAELRRWCESNRNHFYVPEWLLEAWRIKVEDTFSGAA